MAVRTNYLLDTAIMKGSSRHQSFIPTSEKRQRTLESYNTSNQTASPLLLMQKSFQKKLLAEKERKLAELYRIQQDNSMHNISTKSSKQVGKYFQSSANQQPRQLSAKSHHTKLPPIQRHTVKSHSYHDHFEQQKHTNSNYTGHAHQKQNHHFESTKPVERTVQIHNDPVQNQAEKENEASIRPNQDSLRALRKIQQKKKQLHKLNKRHQHEAQFEEEPPSAKLSDFQQWQMQQDNERKQRLKKHQEASRVIDDQRWDEMPNKPKLHHNHWEESQNKKNGGMAKQKQKHDKLEHLRQRMAEAEADERKKQENKVEPSFRETEHRPPLNKHQQHLANPMNQTYSKHSGLSEQMRIYQQNAKVKGERQNDSQATMTAFKKPVLVRRDTRSTTSSRNSNRTTLSPQVPLRAVEENHMRQKQTWKGPKKTSETKYGNVPATLPSESLPQQQDPEEYEVVDVSPCKICGRKFAKDRLKKHIEICSKSTTKKRKVFNMANARKRGTELEGFSGANRTTVLSAKMKQKADWRAQHNDFISTIRQAKKASAYVAAGGNLADLPPPPPSLNPDYVQCPHCERLFNQKAAERHIPHCKDARSRPAPPPSSKKTKKKKRA